MELALQEERGLKLQVEGKLLQLEKEHSMLDCDYKQGKYKLEELQAQKEKLSEEVISWLINELSGRTFNVSLSIVIILYLLSAWFPHFCPPFSF